jgi:hypothetical protein
VTALYPFLLAAARVLYQGERNAGYFTLDDLFIVLGFLLGILGVVYVVGVVALPRRADHRLPAFLAFLALLWLFGFPAAAGALQGHYLWSKVGLGLVGLVLSVWCLWWFNRRPRQLATAATFLTLTGALLVLRFGAGIALDRMHAARQLARSDLAQELARPISGPAAMTGPARDVYLIVLDEYANAQALSEALGFDNRPFVDSLRALGFHVPVVGSNYAHTMLSLPSLLNAAHVQPLAAELGADSKDPTLPNTLLAHNRVARFFQARGYRYVFFPSYWWLSTRTSPIADSVVHVWTGFDLDRELGRTEFRRVLRAVSLLDYVHRDAPWDGDFVRRTLDGVSRLPALKEPVFAFAHVLSPHSPFAFDRHCKTPRRFVEGRRSAEQYVGQLQCLNGMVLAMVTRLIRDSDVPPIILLQGDHGSGLRGFKHAQAVGEVAPLAARERLGAFGAYYLPDGGAAAFGDSVTVVNVLGHVLRRYFGARLPRQPDVQYLSIEDAPFQFRRMDPAWLASGGGEQPSLVPSHTSR